MEIKQGLLINIIDTKNLVQLSHSTRPFQNCDLTNLSCLSNEDQGKVINNSNLQKNRVCRRENKESDMS